MWIVKLALRRPYTFVVMAILILVMGVLAIFRTPTDIFPNINIPVVSIIWSFNGLVPKEMNDRIISITERALTTTVDNIEHIESQSLFGIAVVKVFLQPTASVERGIAQITAVSQTQIEAITAGNHAATHLGLQRIECACSAAGTLGTRSFRAATQRLRSQFHSHPAHHHAGGVCTLSLWR